MAVKTKHHWLNCILEPEHAIELGLTGPGSYHAHFSGQKSPCELERYCTSKATPYMSAKVVGQEEVLN